ncbi:MAG: SDR family NAD(P)-dependent oxidoreductase [Planctomycetota bacterium]|nr:SDR family NAD(P)-dependent oxidoreductase [Planctomycetota bacterium]
MSISDMHVLITGGSRGIGKATAQALRAQGAKVAICGRTEADVQAAASELDCLGLVGDVSIDADAARLVQETISGLGGYDTLLNNAAIGSFAPLVETQAEDVERVFRVNVLGALLVARESARHFLAHGGGTIVNVGSTAARKGYPGGSAYASSKFALSGLTECWRAELRKGDVRVMQVNPSEVQTGFGGNTERERNPNPSKLVASDIAASIVALLALPPRALTTETTIWATNPS